MIINNPDLPELKKRQKAKVTKENLLDLLLILTIPVGLIILLHVLNIFPS
jgi:hypothetical protein